MDILVQKFGGTSVATPETRKALLTQVREAIVEGNHLVLVVSAMGRTGDPYATDTLLGLLEAIDGDISPRKKDLMISCGEIISSALVSHELEANGIPSEPLTGAQAGILTTGDFGNSSILKVNTTKIKGLLRNGKVVVVAGFQGATSEGEVTTLGRGGSDTSAVVLGGYLGAKRVDIFTDVPGIAQVDPRVVPGAVYLPRVKSQDMLRLAEHGAKVIHPRAVQAAIEFGIPVLVRSTFTRGLGTLITDEDFEYELGIIGIAFTKDAEKTNILVLFQKGYRSTLEDIFHEYFQGNMYGSVEAEWMDGELRFSLPTHSFRDLLNGFYTYAHTKDLTVHT